MTVKLGLDQSLSCLGSRALCSFWKWAHDTKIYPKAHHFLLVKIMKPQNSSASSNITFWSLQSWAGSLEAALCQASCQPARTFQQSERPAVICGFAEVREWVTPGAIMRRCCSWPVLLHSEGSLPSGWRNLSLFLPHKTATWHALDRGGGVGMSPHHTTILICQGLHCLSEKESDHRKWGAACAGERGGVWPSQRGWLLERNDWDAISSSPGPSRHLIHDRSTPSILQAVQWNIHNAKDFLNN